VLRPFGVSGGWCYICVIHLPFVLSLIVWCFCAVLCCLGWVWTGNLYLMHCVYVIRCGLGRFMSCIHGYLYDKISSRMGVFCTGAAYLLVGYDCGVLLCCLVFCCGGLYVWIWCTFVLWLFWFNYYCFNLLVRFCVWCMTFLLALVVLGSWGVWKDDLQLGWF